MIISHKQRFIHLKTRKTAGTSLEIALSKFCGPSDVLGWISPEDEAKRRDLGFRGRQHQAARPTKWRAGDLRRMIRDRRLPQAWPEHMTAADAQQALDSDIWNSYFKFAIIRDPHDTIVSRYFWNKKLDPNTPDFRTWLFENPQIVRDNTRIHSIDGSPAVDMFLRYSHLEEDVTKLAERLSLPENPYNIMTSMTAKTGIRPKAAKTSEMFAGFDEGYELVSLLAHEEIELLNGAKETGPAAVKR